jgi:hypothetical protein
VWGVGVGSFCDGMRVPEFGGNLGGNIPKLDGLKKSDMRYGVHTSYMFYSY